MDCCWYKLDLDQFNFFQSILLYNQDKKIKQERRKKYVKTIKF